jgi:O-methyltransferase
MHSASLRNGSQHQETPQPRFFAFDSFAGLPQAPGAHHSDYAPGSYACSEQQFVRNIQRRGVDLKDVVVVPGLYDQTLTRETKERYGLRRAALVMIDCDLYESTVPVLEFLTDLIDQGTILIFHDWFRYRGDPRCGEQRACHEWQERNPRFELIEYWREGPQAVSFLANLR